mgnify:FL=1
MPRHLHSIKHESTKIDLSFESRDLRIFAWLLDLEVACASRKIYHVVACSLKGIRCGARLAEDYHFVIRFNFLYGILHFNSALGSTVVLDVSVWLWA